MKEKFCIFFGNISRTKTIRLRIFCFRSNWKLFFPNSRFKKIVLPTNRRRVTRASPFVVHGTTRSPSLHIREKTKFHRSYNIRHTADAVQTKGISCSATPRRRHCANSIKPHPPRFAIKSEWRKETLIIIFNLSKSRRIIFSFFPPFFIFPNFNKNVTDRVFSSLLFPFSISIEKYRESFFDETSYETVSFHRLVNRNVRGFHFRFFPFLTRWFNLRFSFVRPSNLRFVKFRKYFASLADRPTNRRES